MQVVLWFFDQDDLAPYRDQVAQHPEHADHASTHGRNGNRVCLVDDQARNLSVLGWGQAHAETKQSHRGLVETRSARITGVHEARNQAAMLFLSFLTVLAVWALIVSSNCRPERSARRGTTMAPGNRPGNNDLAVPPDSASGARMFSWNPPPRGIRSSK